MKKTFLLLAIFGVIVNVGANLIDKEPETPNQTATNKLGQEKTIIEVKSRNELTNYDYHCPKSHQSMKCLLINN